MNKVYTLQHLHTPLNGEADVKIIGVYSTEEKIKEAVARLSKAPGFKESFKLIDPLKDKETDGFYMDEYEIDKDHWKEGYVAV